VITDVFCKIIKGELKADFVYKDDDFMVIKDINPKAPVHLLIVPMEHYDSFEDFKNKDAALLGRGLLLAHKMAHQSGVAKKGYRIIINEGEYGGKLVPHFHIHLLGGKRLGPKIVQE
jgi:histidine triad (HIT) family protein